MITTNMVIKHFIKVKEQPAYLIVLFSLVSLGAFRKQDSYR